MVTNLCYAKQEIQVNLLRVQQIMQINLAERGPLSYIGGYVVSKLFKMNKGNLAQKKRTARVTALHEVFQRVKQLHISLDKRWPGHAM